MAHIAPHIVLNTTGFVLNMTGFVLNMTALNPLNMTGFDIDDSESNRMGYITVLTESGVKVSCYDVSESKTFYFIKTINGSFLGHKTVA